MSDYLSRHNNYLLCSERLTRSTNGPYSGLHRIEVYLADYVATITGGLLLSTCWPINSLKELPPFHPSPLRAGLFSAALVLFLKTRKGRHYRLSVFYKKTKMVFGLSSPQMGSNRLVLLSVVNILHFTTFCQYYSNI